MASNYVQLNILMISEEMIAESYLYYNYLNFSFELHVNYFKFGQREWQFTRSKPLMVYFFFKLLVSAEIGGVY